MLLHYQISMEVVEMIIICTESTDLIEKNLKNDLENITLWNKNEIIKKN